MIVSTALMIWKGLMIVTGSESPIVVVLRYTVIKYPRRVESGFFSHWDFFHKILLGFLVEAWNRLFIVVICLYLLTMLTNPWKLAILLYSKLKAVKYRLFIVHSKFIKSILHNWSLTCWLLLFHFFFRKWKSREDGYLKFLTKGDNNQVDDRGLYAPGQYWLERKDLIGKAKGYVSAMLSLQ